MKLRLSSLSAAAMVLFACVMVARPTADRPQNHHEKSSSASVPAKELGETRTARKSKTSARVVNPSRNQPAADLARRFDEIIVYQTDADRKLAEITGTAGAWLQERIDLLEALDPVERSRQLGGIEAEAREMVLSGLERLGVDGELSVKLLAGALEPVHAEIQYASAAPDPASRLAMLRLDRERLLRLAQVRTCNDAGQRSWQLAEINSWYQDGLEAILGNHATADAASDLP